MRHSRRRHSRNHDSRAVEVLEQPVTVPELPQVQVPESGDEAIPVPDPVPVAPAPPEDSPWTPWVWEEVPRFYWCQRTKADGSTEYSFLNQWKQRIEGTQRCPPQEPAVHAPSSVDPPVLQEVANPPAMIPQQTDIPAPEVGGQGNRENFALVVYDGMASSITGHQPEPMVDSRHRKHTSTSRSYGRVRRLVPKFEKTATKTSSKQHGPLSKEIKTQDRVQQWLDHPEM